MIIDCIVTEVPEVGHLIEIEQDGVKVWVKVISLLPDNKFVGEMDSGEA